jgi:hypothetical protein
MSGIIAIDPGYAASGQGCALAHYDHARLRAVWFERPESRALRAIAGVTRVIWECPQVDSRTRVSTPQIVQLAAVGASLAGLYAGSLGAGLEAIEPRSWKGAQPKPAQHLRLWSALSYAERAVLGGDDTHALIMAAARKGAMDRWSHSGASYYGSHAEHNLLDAAGIGLWACGRMSKCG